MLDDLCLLRPLIGNNLAYDILIKGRKTINSVACITARGPRSISLLSTPCSDREVHGGKNGLESTGTFNDAAHGNFRVGKRRCAYAARDNYFFFRIPALSRRTIIRHYRVSLFRLLHTYNIRMKSYVRPYIIPWALFRSYCPNQVPYLNKQDPAYFFLARKKPTTAAALVRRDRFDFSSECVCVLQQQWVYAYTRTRASVCEFVRVYYLLQFDNGLHKCTFIHRNQLLFTVHMCVCARAHERVCVCVCVLSPSRAPFKDSI